MNIETGVFTTVTSGYYIVTYSANALLNSGDVTAMTLYHNGVYLKESFYQAEMEKSDGYSFDPGSRTVILHLLVGDTLDLRTEQIGSMVYRITLCLYMAPAPYGL